MVNLLIHASLDQPIFIFKILSIFVTEEATLMSTALNLPLQLVFCGLNNTLRPGTVEQNN